MNDKFIDERQAWSSLRAGDEDALEYLYRLYYPRLRAYAGRFTNTCDPEAANDIVQECFMSLWRSRLKYKDLSSGAILFAMVRNSCINYLKHEAVVENRRMEYLANIGGEERLYHTDFSYSPEGGLVYEELQAQIKLVIDSLTPRCREVFLLSRFTRLSNAEVAGRLGISVAAVEKQMTKALGAFRSHFQKKYPVEVYAMVLVWILGM